MNPAVRSTNIWNQGIEHPMIAKYIYGVASLRVYARSR